MKNKLLFCFLLLVACTDITLAQKSSRYTLKSPDGNIVVTVDAGAKFTWSVTHGADVVIAPSTISLSLQTGEVLGQNVKLISAKQTAVNTVVRSHWAAQLFERCLGSPTQPM